MRMDGKAFLHLVDQLERDRNISRDVIFGGIEAAITLAAQKHFGEPDEVEGGAGVSVTIDRDNGTIEAKRGAEPIEPEVLGRIAAQAAKQLMIQKFREAECQAVFDEYAAKKGDLVKGTVQRFEHGTATVTIGGGKSEAILPRGEQIPGETHHVGDRIDAVILDVKKNGHRVKIILSRTHPDFVRQLFDKEIPEVADRTIEIKAIAREAGYRTKVAVTSIDMKVDCVGACVGVRGSRIKNIVDALSGERIDIVRWNDSLQVLIPNSLQPAQIEEVFLYARLGRAIVLVQEDQLSLAIGRRGQNVRLGSKLVGWDIEIMTHDELNQSIERAEGWFGELPHATPEVIEAFIEEGLLSYDDLTCVEGAELAEIGGLTPEQGEEIYDFAENMADSIGEEVRSPRLAEGAEGRHARSSAASQMDRLFGQLPPETPGEQQPTAASLFREQPAGESPAEGEPEPTAVVSEEGTAAPAEAVPVESLQPDGTTEAGAISVSPEAEADVPRPEGSGAEGPVAEEQPAAPDAVAEESAPQQDEEPRPGEGASGEPGASAPGGPESAGG